MILLLLVYRRKSDLVHLDNRFTLYTSDILSHTIDISNINICGFCSAIISDSFADQCLTRSIRIEIHTKIAIRIYHLKKNKTSVMEIQEKIVLITGGASGIGYCTARELLQSGAKAVAIVDLSDSNGETAVAELKKEFGADHVIFLAGDVTNAEELTACFDKAIESLGTLDIVINNAGIMNDAEWEPMIDINYKGIVRGTILGLNYMGKHKGGKGGTIVNMSSIVGLQGNPIAPIYAGTQFAIVGFTLSLQTFYDKTGIRVMVICPGLTNTGMASKFMSSKVYAMDVLDDEIAAKEMTTMESQPPEHVASAIVELIEKGENGAIFVSENNQPAYSVQLPSYTDLKVSV